ncbi:hypothetical protein K2173_016590 [Erythroxylum novogranatense]|uniref:CBF1-interacting co-repressor CIR N-terminal domain-containing protein n=1 Tax=Erythroxylum novogranatense TaxID=1862640 RepID=A0AAV8SGS1_9ROSI|nr:hypothetical protein K2173_016590 [Erythroxylum novogranatense]
MGGHGGLNILPQKSWNVYNYENREKVRRDEEAADREEQLKREQARKRDAEYRLQQLRTARGLAPLNKPTEPETERDDSEPKTNHINLFEGIKIFDPIKESENEKDGSQKKKQKKKKEEVRVVTAEDEKYRLGYGVAGKGVKLPWYLEKRSRNSSDGVDEDEGLLKEEKGKKGGVKKTMEELREERLKREKREKERERELLLGKRRRDGADRRDGGYYRR